MKKFYFFLLSLFTAQLLFAAPLIKAITNGNWNQTSTWDLSRLPQVGDTILIPEGKTVMVTDDQIINGFAYLKLYGKLGFQNNNSTLQLGTSSVIFVYSGGQIVGGGSASQKIRLGGFSIFQGNDAPVNGPQMATAATNGFQAYMESPLPVKFIGFTLSSRNSEIMVQWSTSEEINASHYELERSTDGKNWQMAATIRAKGNSNQVNNYSYTDKNPVATAVYYRIRQVDLDGRFTYTSIRSIKTDKTADINIASIDHKVLLQFSKEMKGSFTVRFVNANGQVAGQQVLMDPLGQIVLNASLKGNYIIQVTNGQNLNIARQVIL